MDENSRLPSKASEKWQILCSLIGPRNADKLTQQLQMHWFNNRPVRVEVCAADTKMTYIMPSVNTWSRPSDGPWPIEHYLVPRDVNGTPFELNFSFDPATFTVTVR